MSELHNDPSRGSSGEEDSESESVDMKAGFGLVADTEATLRITEELGSRVNAFRDELRASIINVGEDTEVLDRLKDLAEALAEKTPSQYRIESASPTFESQPSDSRPVTPIAMPQQNIKELENQLHILAHKKRGSTAGVVAPPTSSTPPPEGDKDGASSKQVKELTEANAALTAEIEALKKSTSEDRQRSATRSTTDTRRALTPRATKSHSGGLLAPNTEQEQEAQIKSLNAKLKEQTAELKSLQEEKASAAAVKKQIMTGLEAMRLENDELRNEREELDRQIIALKLDNEDAEAQISELETKQNRAEAQREEAKAGERRRIQTAAALLRKELSKESQKREERYKAENSKLEEQVLALQEQVLLAEGGGDGGNSQLYQQELQKRRLLQSKLSDLNGNIKVLCCSETVPNVTADPTNSTITTSNTTYELDTVTNQDTLLATISDSISTSILDGFSCCLLLLNTTPELTSKFLQNLATTVVESKKSQSEKGWSITATMSRDDGQELAITDVDSVQGMVEKCVDPSSNSSTPTMYKLTVDGSNPQLGFDSHGESNIITLPSEIANSILSLLPPKAAPPTIQSLLQPGAIVSIAVPVMVGDDTSVASQLEILQKIRDIEFGKPKKHVKRSK